MKHIKALLIKFAVAVVAFYLVVHFAVSIWEILLASLVFSLVGYFVGDLFVLPYTGNFIAVVLDAAFVWVLGAFLYQSYTDIAPALSAFVIAISEWIFHYYVERRVLEKTTAS